MTIDSGEPVAEHVPHPPAKSKNLQIQWLRISAAVAVMLFHASAIAQADLHDGRFFALFDGRLGIYGVSLFFAISGYLMAVAIRFQPPFAFLAHRVVRIYPLLWIVYIGYFALHYACGHSDHIDLRLFLLAPYGQEGGLLGVEWSLVFEVTFYLAIFAIGLVGAARQLSWIALGWLGLLAVHTYLYLDNETLHPFIQNILSHAACVPLAAGLLVPWLLTRRIGPLSLLSAGIAICAVQSFGVLSLDIARWLYGIGSALILAAAIATSQRRPSFGDTRLGRAFAHTGDYTYALYLVHMPIIRAVYHYGAGRNSVLLWSLGVALSLFIAIVAGEAEMRLYRRLKTAVNAADAKTVRIALCGFIALYAIVAVRGSVHEHIAIARDRQAALLATALKDPASLPPAGYTASPTLIGAVDGAGWEEGTLTVTGWAIDTGPQHVTPMILIVQGGHIVGSAGTSGERPDVRRAYKTKRDAGFIFVAPLACQPGVPIEVMAVSDDKRYAAMPVHTQPACQ